MFISFGFCNGDHVYTGQGIKCSWPPEPRRDHSRTVRGGYFLSDPLYLYLLQGKKGQPDSALRPAFFYRSNWNVIGHLVGLEINSDFTFFRWNMANPRGLSGPHIPRELPARRDNIAGRPSFGLMNLTTRIIHDLLTIIILP